MSNDIAGQVAIVAGGTGGLGRAVSLAFLDARRHRDRDLPDAGRVRRVGRGGSRSRPAGSRAGASTLPMKAKRAGVVGEIVAQRGRLDALVNTVGGYTGGTKLWDLDAGALERMLAMNLRSGYALARAAVPVMLKQERVRS